MNNSRRTHGGLTYSLTEDSHREGKGREGNRKGRRNSPIHDRYNKRAREAVDNSRPNVLTVMDGCYADEIEAA